MRTAFLYTVIVLASAVTAFAADPPPAAKPAKAKKISAPALVVQGFSPGMAMPQVRQLLKKKGVNEYTTAYADLFVYSPAPNTELRLRFTCAAKGWVLGAAELETVFSREEAAVAVPKYRDMLLAKYGVPALSSAAQDRIDLCWGACLSGAKGTRAAASTSDTPDGMVRLRLVVENSGLMRACQGDRENKIGRWLTQWARDIARFQLGMSVREASRLYQKRFGDPLYLVREKEDGGGRKPVTVLAAKEHDFFAGLDADSLLFEGKGPGQVALRFTGNEAEFATGLNERLFSLSFTTTSFSDDRQYRDLDGLLAPFLRAYGKPIEIIRQTGMAMATWQGGGKKRQVTVSDTGLITVEQFDSVLLETYRDAAVQRQQGDAATRFDKNIF